MKTEKLVRYMKVRSKVEECKWSLDDDYLQPSFINGVRNFFGVQLDNSGNLLFDEQEPYKGFLYNWETMVGWLREIHTPSEMEFIIDKIIEELN